MTTRSQISKIVPPQPQAMMSIPPMVVVMMFSAGSIPTALPLQATLSIKGYLLYVALVYNLFYPNCLRSEWPDSQLVCCVQTSL